ncbi:MAG: DUF502 domain-containing protein [Gammaproteobacteria bacterium]|nr:DUF502 domain-containing protein [Gammaproteobacteria bacterium]
MAFIRKYLLAGLLFWLPVWVTFLIIRFLVQTLDVTLDLLPAKYHPDQLLGIHIPGLGLIFTIIILFLTGIIVTNVLGGYLLRLWDGVIKKIPLIRSIYMGVKKTVDTVLSPKGQAFRKVLLVEYPREGLWSLAFQTGTGCKEVSDKMGGTDLVTIFIPTTPNPTSGFLMMLPKEKVRELDMSVEDALKMIISLGVVKPKEK